MYKKEYDQTIENKDKNWRQKQDYKNLEDLDYQSDQPQQSDHLIPKWVNVTKCRLDEIGSITIESIKHKLRIAINENQFYTKQFKKISRRHNQKGKKQAINDCNSIVEDVNTILKSRTTKKQ